MVGYRSGQKSRLRLWVTWLRETLNEFEISASLLGPQVNLLGTTIQNWLDGKHLPHARSAKRVENHILSSYEGAKQPPSLYPGVPEPGELFVEWLVAANWTQRQAARRTGLSEDTICHICNGKRTPNNTTMAIFIQGIHNKTEIPIGDLYERLHQSILRRL